jgi:hypothetical protein
MEIYVTGVIISKRWAEHAACMGTGKINQIFWLENRKRPLDVLSVGWRAIVRS